MVTLRLEPIGRMLAEIWDELLAQGVLLEQLVKPRRRGSQPTVRKLILRAELR